MDTGVIDADVIDPGPLGAGPGPDGVGLIGMAEVERRTGLSRKALRLYESLGLVEPAGRNDSGYRRYDAEALRRIELVGRAKVLGLTLAEAKEFLHVAEGCCGENHPELAAIVARKLSETETRIAELRELRSTLNAVIDRLADNEGLHRCEEALCTCGGTCGNGLQVIPKPAR